MKQTRSVAAVLLALMLISLQSGLASDKRPKRTVPESVPAFGNADAVNASQMKDYLTFIASDELEGRDTPSRGLDTAAKFIGLSLSRWGLKPAGDGGTYFQRIPLRRTRIDPSQTRVEINGQVFNFGDDFLAQSISGTATAPAVFVGHGMVIKSKKIDPYQGIDVAGKIVVAVFDLPKGVTQADVAGKEGESWEGPYGHALRNRAKGLILVPTFQALANWAQSRQNSIDRGTVQVEKYMHSDNGQIPSVTGSPRLLNALFQGEKFRAAVIFNRLYSAEPVPAFDLSADKKVTISVSTKQEPASTQNVVAVLEGSDPVLKDEYVAIGAHYDHVGIGPAVNGDSIYNGADDDGSGTVAVMALAEAFARGPRPKRSILFIWHAGEEKGLWGSRFITDQPPVPIDHIVTQLNIDMIGRSRAADDKSDAHKNLPGPNEVYLIGSKMMSTELGEVSEKVNKAYLNLKFNYKYDDPKDPEQFFYRSDHFNYARKGIPIIFYMDGDHEDYHRPSDSVEKIDFVMMERVARTVYATAWELANRAARPKVDKPLPADVVGN